MNAIKSLAIITVLALAGIGLYLHFTSEVPETLADYTKGLEYVGDDIAAPQIEMPTAMETSSLASAAPTAITVPPLTGSTGTGSTSTGPAPIAFDFAFPVVKATALPAPYSSGSVPVGNSSHVSATPPLAAQNGATPLSDGSGAYAVTRQMAQALLDRGELANAHLLLSRSYGDPTLSPSEHDELTLLLGQLAGTVIYSHAHLLEPAHRVVAGETLESIAQSYNVPWPLLAKINGLSDPAHVTVGQELKVVRGPFSAVVSSERRELTLMVGGRYAGRFAVGIGRDHEAIEGIWLVDKKQINPTYYGPSGMIDADDPANPLGEHMLGLVNPTAGVASKPFGIHGTHDPTSIQSNDPRGFIRLAPKDAEDVFDILAIGSKVVIRRQSKLLRHEVSDRSFFSTKTK